jgi:hypothetical protein
LMPQRTSDDGITRRNFAKAFALAPALGHSQGIATRNISPQPRGKPSGRPFEARFIDIAAEAGLTLPITYGTDDRKSFIIEAVGCGAAFIDYDNDGWLEWFILSGRKLDSDIGMSNRLYKNNRDGTFRDVTQHAGLLRSGWASAVAVADYDNDGFDDLFVTYWGQNVLYHNNGNGTFTDVTREAGLLEAEPRWNSGCTFIDYDRDGNLDLFVGSYLEFDLQKVRPSGSNATCNWKGIPVHCGPRGLPPGAGKLYRNTGRGEFTDVSDNSGISKAKGSYMMTAVAADFDNDGWPDLYVACDSTPSFLFHNNRDGTFSEVGLRSGVALNIDGMEQAGMGLGIGDYNLDGNLDILKTHFAGDTSILYRNDGKGLFDDVTNPCGLGTETRYIGWGVGIVDLDNDGQPDLFAVTGGIFPEVQAKLPDYPLRTPRTIFRNLGGGKFEELTDGAGPGVSALHCSRGCAFGDFDNDGDIDVLIINLNEPPSLLRNDLKRRNHWIKVKLIGSKSNRSGIGARVVAKYGNLVHAQEVLSQSSFYSCNDPRLHFGLGAYESVDLEVLWPSGQKQGFEKISSGQLVTIREAEGIVNKQVFPFS